MTDFVLVHGAAHGAWCWEPMLPHLQGRPGVGEVVALDLVGHGQRAAERPLDEITREDYLADVVGAIESRDLRDVVLVGHSNAGTIIPQAATRVRPRIRRLVFVSCMIPREGRTTAETFRDLGAPFPMRPEASQEENYRRAFCNDMDEATARWVLDRLTPEPPGPLAEPVTRPGFPRDLPMTYVVLLRDQALVPDLQRQLLTHIGSPEVVELDAGHDAMVSRPRDLAEILLRYV